MTAPAGFDPKLAYVVSQWPSDRPLNACRFDPTGKFVFCGAEDANVERYNLADGARTNLTGGHDTWVQAIGFSKDGAQVFSGCSPNGAGHCDVTVRFNVYQPNGKVFATTPPMEVWQYKPAPPAQRPQLSVEYLKLTVEPHDPLGKYTVSASVKDHVSGASIQVSTAFTATK